MTRFLTRAEMHVLLIASGDPVAVELAERLHATGHDQLVAVEPAKAQVLLPTYEVRLARAEEGQGPRTRGLAQFVDALKAATEVELFSIHVQGAVGVGILVPGRGLVAVTLVLARGPGEP